MLYCFFRNFREEVSGLAISGLAKKFRLMISKLTIKVNVSVISDCKIFFWDSTEAPSGY